MKPEVKQPPVTDQLDRLGSSLERLEEDVGTLSTHLRPVLTPTPETDSAKASGGTDRQPESSLTGHVRRLAERIESLSYEVRAINHNLEL